MVTEIDSLLPETFSLLAGLDGRDLGELAPGLKPFEAAEGDIIISQGATPDGVYFLLSGDVTIATRMPGGGETFIAALGAGTMLGELGLIDPSPRSATVTAASDAAGLFLERAFFNGALDQRAPFAIKIMRQMLRLMCERQRALNGRVVDGTNREILTTAADEDPSAAPDTPAGPGEPFDHRAYLSVLPFFAGFDGDGIDQVYDLTVARALPEGAVLLSEGEPGRRCFIVVRGAAAVSSIRDGRKHQLGILGPGRMVGPNAMIDGGRSGATATVRSAGLFLELDKAGFDELWSGSSRTSVSFLKSVGANLVQNVVRTNSDLTRITGYRQILENLAAD